MNALRTADTKNCHSPVVPLITILYVRECQTQNGNKNKKQTSAHLNKQLFPPYTSDERKNNRESAEGQRHVWGGEPWKRDAQLQPVYGKGSPTRRR